MRLARVCLLSSLLPFIFACSGSPLSGEIWVVAHAELAASRLGRVTVTITPAGQTQNLAVDPSDPSKFTGTFLAVPVGTQTVKAVAYDQSGTEVGGGTATVSVTKGVHMQASITIFDSSGPVGGPDHSPVVLSFVTPTSAQVDDQLDVSATAMDPDGDGMAYSWTAAPSGCGTFGDATLAATKFTAKTVGGCTVTFTVTAGGKSDSRNATVQIAQATGSIDVDVTFVPQPVIGSIALSQGGTVLASVTRDSPDATIRTPFHKGTAYTVTLTFDPWPSGSISLSDSCSGTIVQPTFPANGPSASGTWTPAVDSGVCELTATLTRDTLTDTFFVVVLPAP